MTQPVAPSALTPLPLWLAQPIGNTILPPVHTRLQSLPYDQLSWQDFERLCLRLAQRATNVEGCRLYGEQGDAQAGIDLYALEINSEKYIVYQCKRVMDFGPAKIEAAVEKFLTAEGFVGLDRIATFVLCTMESLRGQLRDDMFRAQKDILEQRNIKFERWDQDYLNHKLKDAPEVVDDFFGRSWVAIFCGEDAARNLGNRLDAHKFMQLRQGLRSFYNSVFEQHDSGVALTESERVRAPSLQERFVVPDILDSVSESLIFDQRIETLDNQPEIEFEMEGKQRRRREIRLNRIHSDNRRRGLERWLSEHDAYVILGGPGSGKSTLLRFLALDLLDESPTLTQVASRWGQYIPVWVPFAFWTRAISFEGDNTISLHDVMRQWLQAFNAQHLTPLIECALDDGRLLLVVDGLDEYVRSDYGELALDRLRVFVQQRSVPVMLSSRPDGYKLFKTKLSGWTDGHIADLSENQQRRLGQIWFTHQLRNANTDLTNEAVLQRASIEVEGFFEDLHDSSDLAQLAGVPLLLCLLIALRRAEVALPRSRFRVYEEVVKHLLEAHPRRRRRAAAMADDDNSISPLDMRQAFERLAFEMHCSYPEGVIPIEEASEVLARYLHDSELGLGLERREARRLSAQLVSVGDTNSGLLVGRSPHEAGFFHRSLQEFLAAGYLSRLDDQLVSVEEHRLDPQWREVILATLHFTRQPQQVRRLMSVLRAPCSTVGEKQHLSHLLAEAAFGEFPVPAAVAQDIAREALVAIEYETWAPQRERLLSQALDGLQSAKVRDLVYEKLRQWFPERIRYRSSVLEAMQEWPLEEETILLLIRGLYEEDAYERKASSKTLAHLGNKEPRIFSELKKIARQAHSIEAQLGAMHALILGSLKDEEVDELLDFHVKSPAREQRLIAYFGLARQGRLEDEYLEEILKFRDYDYNISFAYRDLIPEILSQGWPQDPRVKEACINGISENLISDDIDWKIIIQNFSSHNEAISMIKNQIMEQNTPFMASRDAWPLVLEYLSNNPEIIEAIDERFNREDLPKLQGRGLFFASLISRSELAKDKLIQDLDDKYSHWAAEALLDIWGMHDHDVSHSLLRIVNGENSAAAGIGLLIPRIIEDKEAARQRLVELLKDEKCPRPDFVLQGISEVGLGEDEDIILNAALHHISRNEVSDVNGTNHILNLFSNNNRVLNYSQEIINRGSNWLYSVALHMRNHQSIRELLRQYAMPLDPASRFLIAIKLKQRIGDSQELLGLLGKYHEERDPDTRVQSAISFASRSRSEGHDLAPVKDLFLKQANDNISIGNLNLQSSIAGLLTLGVLNENDIAVHSQSLKNWIPFLTTYSHDVSNTFVAMVIQHWEDTRDVFQTLHDPSEANSLPSIGPSLARYADTSSLATKDLIYAIENNIVDRKSIEILQFLGRVAPTSNLLLETCLEVINEENPPRDILMNAIQLIGRHFAGNLIVTGHLEDNIGNLPPKESFLMALIEVFPESSRLKDIFEWYSLNNESATYSLYFRLACLYSKPDKIITTLKSAFEHYGKDPAMANESITPPLIKRLQRDADFANALSKWLMTDNNPSVTATISRLLARAGVLSDVARRWCIAEIDRLSLEGSAAPIGIDLLAGRARPILHSLLDAV